MSFALMNTYSRDATKPNKFRVIVPFRRPAQSVDEFHAVYDYIVRRIEERGYRKPPRVPDGTNVDAGGLDRSSRSPTQFFYWPCTNAAHPEGAFFRVCGLQRRELERYAIDPQDVAMNAPAPPIVVPVPMPTGSSDREKVDEAIRQWRDVGCAPGNGNHEFFRLGSRLAYAGLPEYEIQGTLAEQCQYAHSPKDRRRNIPYVMKSLRRQRVVMPSVATDAYAMAQRPSPSRTSWLEFCASQEKLDLARRISPIEMFDGIAVHIETHGAIRRVVDDKASGRTMERRRCEFKNVAKGIRRIDAICQGAMTAHFTPAAPTSAGSTVARMLSERLQETGRL